MSDRNEKAVILQDCVGRGRILAGLVEYANDSIVSKTVLDKSAGSITLFAFDRGQKLSEHRSPFDAVVQIIEGTARLTIGGKEQQVSTGEIIIMPADIPHCVGAEKRFKMLLIMIRGREKEAKSGKKE